MAPAVVFTFKTPAQPLGLLAAISSARRYPLPAPPATMSSPLAVSSKSVLSPRLDPGPWIFSGDVTLSVAAITEGPAARPEATWGVWEAQVLA